MEIFVSGVGIVSPLGWGGRGSWRSLAGARQSAATATDSGAAYRFDPASVLGHSGLRRIGRANAVLLAAAALSLAERERTLAGVSAEETGVVTVTGTTVLEDFFAFRRLVTQDGLSDHAGLLSLYRNLFANASAANISIRFGLKGQGATLSGGWRAGVEAVHHAIRLLKGGRLKALVLGAIERAPQALAGKKGEEEKSQHEGPRREGEVPEVAAALLLRAETKNSVPPGAFCKVSAYEAWVEGAAGSAPAKEGGLLSRVSLAVPADKASEEEICEKGLWQPHAPLAALLQESLAASFPLAFGWAALMFARGTLPPWGKADFRVLAQGLVVTPGASLPGGALVCEACDA